MLALDIAARDQWLHGLIEKLVQQFPQIAEVYLVGDYARGVQGQLPDFNILLYAGYENTLPLLVSLARGQQELCPPESDACVHCYVENYGGALTGVWGGSLIQNEEMRNWREGQDYMLVYTRAETDVVGLPGRIVNPLERRQQDRRFQERRRDMRGNPGRRGADRRQGFSPEAFSSL